MPSIVVFCDGNSLAAARLLNSLIIAVKRASGYSIAGVVASKLNTRPTGKTVEHFAKSAGIKFFTHEKGALKNPGFVDKLFGNSKPEVLFSIYCLEKFDAQFLDRFQYTVNYHNGLLPQYKGLSASAWALAMGETQCGYTFHRMTPKLDAGNILIQGKIKINSNDSVQKLERKMTRHAGKQLPSLLAMIENRSQGVPQTGGGSYFSKSDQSRVKRLTSPETLPAKQLINLCRAFGEIHIKLAGRWFRIKRIGRAKRNRKHADCLYFNASDGGLIEACEFIGLERVQFRMKQAIKRCF